MIKLLEYKEINDVQKRILKKINKEFTSQTTNKIYDSIINIMNNIDNKNSIEIIRKLSTIKPIYKFQTLYDLLYEFAGDKESLQNDFIELKKYIGFDIDIFMLNNVLFCM